MQELAVATFAALEDADLREALEQLHRRVFVRSPELLFDVSATSNGAWQWRFKPMVELLLRHIRHTATQQDVSKEDRLREITWVLDTSGF